MSADKLRILMIGHGAIGGYVAGRLAESRTHQITATLCREGRENAARAVYGDAAHAVTKAASLSGTIDVAVDVAGHGGLRSHGAALLSMGVPVITVSSGALADAALAAELADAAARGGVQLTVLSGAIGALDALSAARAGGLESVRYTGCKPPKGWAGSAAEETLDLNALSAAAVHFEGSAREAALRYPKNANVAASVALAGLGMDETQARLIADPDATGNQHIVEASGAFGSFNFTIEGNALPGNPRSSALTAMSVVRALEDLTAPVVV